MLVSGEYSGNTPFILRFKLPKIYLLGVKSLEQRTFKCMHMALSVDNDITLPGPTPLLSSKVSIGETPVNDTL